MTPGELGLHSPLLFAVAVLVLNATPGVDMVLVLARTLQQGVRTGMAREAVTPLAGEQAGIERQPPVSPAVAFRQGLLTNVLNPKVALFFLALLPQFIASDAAHKTLAFLALGAWFVLQSLAFLMLFVLLTAPLARWRPGLGVRRSLQGAGALLFAGLAARLAVAER